MGRSPCCDKTRVKKGPWSDEEDALLSNFMANFGNDGNWITLPKKAGLNRCGKSCRLRWINYLRPDVKHGDFTDEEDYIIYTLYNTIGSRWSMIASKLPAGRTDNEVKNYWNTKLKKKISSGKFDNNIMNSKFEISKHDHFMLFDQIGQNDIFNMEDIGENNIQKSYIITSDSSSSSNSSVTPEISSSTSSSVDSTNNSNSNNSVLFGGEEDEFWMDLLSDSFDDDDVVVVGSRLDDKINEIASLLYD